MEDPRGGIAQQMAGSLLAPIGGDLSRLGFEQLGKCKKDLRQQLMKQFLEKIV